jgi:hypothetical protein
MLWKNKYNHEESLEPFSAKAVIKNKEINDHKNPDDSSDKALIPAFFLFTRVRKLLSPALLEQTGRDGRENHRILIKHLSDQRCDIVSG